MVGLSADYYHSDSPLLQTLKYASTAVEMNTSAALLCFNSAFLLFSDNICVILLWLELNKNVEFALLCSACF